MKELKEGIWDTANQASVLRVEVVHSLLTSQFTLDQLKRIKGIINEAKT